MHLIAKRLLIAQSEKLCQCWAVLNRSLSVNHDVTINGLKKIHLWELVILQELYDGPDTS